jgi:hypothetical protein
VKDGSEPPKKKAAKEKPNQEATSSTQQPINGQYFSHQQFGQPPTNGQYFPPQQFGHYTPQGQFIPQKFDQANGINPEMSYHQQQQHMMNPNLFQPQMRVKVVPKQPQFNNFTPNPQQPSFAPSRINVGHGQPQVNKFGLGQQQVSQFNYSQQQMPQFNYGQQVPQQFISQNQQPR